MMEDITTEECQEIIQLVRKYCPFIYTESEFVEKLLFKSATVSRDLKQRTLGEVLDVLQYGLDTGIWED